MPLPSFVTSNLISLAGPMGPAVGGALAPVGAPATPFGAAPVQPLIQTLVFPMQVQEEANWCWAAVAVSTGTYYTPAAPVLSQCQMATLELAATGVIACCPPKSNPACDIPWFLHTALSRLGRYGGYVPGAANFAGAVVPQIAAGRPVAFRIDWGNGTGHFVVVTAYDQSSGSQMVTIDDPSPATPGGSTPQQHILDYATFTTSFPGIGIGTGSVSDTLWTI